MDNLLTVVFEAHNAEKNHHRRYRVTLGRDLLDHWTLWIDYGRVGVGEQRMQFASPTPDTIKSIIRDRLQRRRSHRSNAVRTGRSGSATRPPVHCRHWQ